MELRPFTRRVQIRSNALILYDQPEYLYTVGKRNLQAMLVNMMEAKKQAYSGEMRDGTKKRIARAIDLLVQISKSTYGYNEVTKRMQKHRLSFITLTISQFHDVSIRDAYEKCFVPFIQWLRRTKKVSSYVWKAELQQRGIIHYHITTPAWISYTEIRDKWNNLQRSAGYVAVYQARQMAWHRNGFKPRPELFKHWPLKKQKAAYDVGMKSQWQNPNSTDIHEVRKVNDLSGYLKKEFCKTIQGTMKRGKVWDCSRNLKHYKYYTVDETPYIENSISDLLEAGKVTPKCLDSCIVIEMKKEDITQIINMKQVIEYDTYLASIRDYKEVTKNKRLCKLERVPK